MMLAKFSGMSINTVISSVTTAASSSGTSVSRTSPDPLQHDPEDDEDRRDGDDAGLDEGLSLTVVPADWIATGCPVACGRKPTSPARAKVTMFVVVVGIAGRAPTSTRACPVTGLM